MPTVLQPVLGTFGYSPHLSAFDIAFNLLFALLTVLFFRLLRFTWPQTFLCLFISGYVALFGNPNLVLRAVSYVSALGAILMSAYLFAIEKRRPRQTATHLSKRMQWIGVAVLYMILTYVILRTVAMERWKKQAIEDGWGTTVHKLDLASSTSSANQRIAFGGISVAVPSAGLASITNLNDMILRVSYDNGCVWAIWHPEKHQNYLESIREDSDSGFPLWWFVSGLTAKEFYAELVAADPTYLRPFQSIWTSSRLRFFLIMQGIFLNTSRIHSFDNAEYSGFQFGSPDKDKDCKLIFFDDAGDAYQVFFHANKETMHQIDQKAMNEVIKSFRVKLENDTSLTK